ncbi:MAG: rubredoxin domain-containing protein [Paludibacter sp.]|nr:rubredoxin domain-containing protein [Paludibacter sp.]
MSLGKKQTIRVLAKGGILTPSHLSRILGIAKLAGSDKVHFGSRQDLLFDVKSALMPQVQEAFKKIDSDYIVYGNKGLRSQNIVSSYVSADIMNSTSWLSSGNYLYVLEKFNYQPKLRVNIADPEQSLVPLMFGQLNFIASPIQHYWYLYIRRTDDEIPVRWPVMVLSDDICVLAQALERFWADFRRGNVSDWFEFLQHRVEYNNRKVEQEPRLDFKYSHDYEGFGKMHASKNYWAGLYWRNNEYEIDFLEKLCALCLQTGISKICITPWKSFMVKEIAEKDLILWDQLLGKFGINMRHSSFDMNWHLPFKNKMALRLKRRIVKAFDSVDVCVYGLTFGIKAKNDFSFYSIQLERKVGIKLINRIDLLAFYKILYVRNFNSNLCEYTTFSSFVPWYRIPAELQKLTLKFYSHYLQSSEVIETESDKKETKTLVYQCEHCQSVYDEKKGMIAFDIPAGTRFDKLPDTFKCRLCDAPKAYFKPVYFEQLLKNAQV